ncbi:hypothetical protein V1478_017437 [Vespula squamosa]|uniref:Uncharacterized protein n=1 Tax=Vespula squamosa TaxID=30214 RepID=A0ABD1ZWU5_VESSQ
MKELKKGEYPEYEKRKEERWRKKEREQERKTNDFLSNPLVNTYSAGTKLNLNQMSFSGLFIREKTVVNSSAYKLKKTFSSLTMIAQRGNERKSMRTTKITYSFSPENE